MLDVKNTAMSKVRYRVRKHFEAEFTAARFVREPFTAVEFNGAINTCLSIVCEVLQSTIIVQHQLGPNHDNREVEVHGQLHQFRSSVSVKNSNVLEVVAAPLLFTGTTPHHVSRRTLTTTFDFQAVCLYTPDSWKPPLRSVACGLIKAAIEEFNAITTQAICDIPGLWGQRLAEELYSILRRSLPPEQASLPQLAVLADGKAGRIVYLSDKDRMIEIAAAIQHSRRDSSISNALLISEFMRNNVEYPLLHAREAIETQTPITSSLHDSKYKNSLPVLNSAEACIFGSERITLVPVATHERLCMVAVYGPQHHQLLYNAIQQLTPQMLACLDYHLADAHSQNRYLQEALAANRPNLTADRDRDDDASGQEQILHNGLKWVSTIERIARIVLGDSTPFSLASTPSIND
ncbi:MAG: hypothetical protein KF864_01840 [Phycisphaeraceae bacterium]|nr:hypothetical protein [Phycisphaeraceae bacterium]